LRHFDNLSKYDIFIIQSINYRHSNAIGKISEKYTFKSTSDYYFSSSNAFVWHGV